ncbi:MAG: ABC transporter substrate-binding protein [Clostridia bacterium]|nr:ABC transporter substrate-binding protein [Clostridia bacterium]
MSIIIALIVFLAAFCSYSIYKTGDNIIEEFINYDDTNEYVKYSNQRFAISDIKSLNPLVSDDVDTYYMSKVFFSSLFKENSKLTLEKDLVNKYSVDSENGTVSISLIDDAICGDGSHITGNDVSFTVDQIKNYGKKSPFYTMAKKISYVQVQGTYSIKIVFSDASDAALNNLTFPIVSRNSYSDDKDYVPNGSGQYVVKTYKKASYIKAVPNEDYYGEVATNSLYFQMLRNGTDLYNFLNTFDITAMVYKDFNGKSIAEDKNLTYNSIPSNCLEYIGFNFNNEILQDKYFRKALANTVNTNDIINKAYSNIGIPVDSIYFPEYLESENTGDMYPYDFSNAVSILDKIRAVDSDDDGYREYKNGEKIELNILVNENNPDRILAANELVSNFDSVQIKAKVNALPWEEYKQAIKNSNFDIVIGGFKIDKADNLESLFDKGNILNYENDQILALAKSLKTTMNIKDYKETYENLKELLKADLPYYPICYKTYSFFQTQYASSEIVPSYFDVYSGVSTWRYKKIVPKDEED